MHHARPEAAIALKPHALHGVVHVAPLVRGRAVGQPRAEARPGHLEQPCRHLNRVFGLSRRHQAVGVYNLCPLARRAAAFSGTRSLSRAHVCAFRPRAARTPRPLGPARSPRPLAPQHPVVGRLVVGPELLGHLGDRPFGGDHVVGGLAPGPVGVAVVAHALPRFLGCLGIYDSWVLNLGCPCPKKRYRSSLRT